MEYKSDFKVDISLNNLQLCRKSFQNDSLHDVTFHPENKFGTSNNLGKNLNDGIHPYILRIKLTSRRKPNKVKVELEETRKPIFLSANNLTTLKLQKLTENDKREKRKISNETYCTILYVEFDKASITKKIYSSSEEQFKYEAISKSFVSSYHTYLLKPERTDCVETLIQCYDIEQGELSPDQNEKPVETQTTSILKQLSFVSKFTLNVNEVINPITSSDVNMLVRCKMINARQSKPPKCKPKKSPRKTMSTEIGYLQQLILQSDLVLCNPLDDDSDSEGDVVLHDNYFSDFCYFDILDLDILYQIFHLLPTRDLAVLKCVCQDFKWFIEFYDIGGVDSKWAESNSYRDDPCMHCGKIKDPSGDVSLCRWHPKGYYKDGHYGRHYWICCRQSNEDAAGCMVGVHDNNWTTSQERLCHIPKPKRKHSWNKYLTVIK